MKLTTETSAHGVIFSERIGWALQIRTLRRDRIPGTWGQHRKGRLLVAVEHTARGMPTNIEVQDAPTVVADDEKSVEHVEGERWYREEVHRGNRLTVIVQKG